MLRELAPLLAEEGVDANNIDVPDMDTLRRALDRAPSPPRSSTKSSLSRRTTRPRPSLAASGSPSACSTNGCPGRDPERTGNLAQQTRLPAGDWLGERAATDILTLARKGRAFHSLDALLIRQGGRHVLYGSALALAAATQSWSQHSGTAVPDLAHTTIH